MTVHALRRLEGRLFAEDGCLFMVLQIDGESARVSCRLDGRTRVVDLPTIEVTQRVAASAGLALDNLHGPQATRRVLHKDDGWYFASREGLIGRYPSEDDAASALARYVLAMQTMRSEGETLPAAAGMPCRRVTDRADTAPNLALSHTLARTR
jgi:hypothetical protein